MPYIVTVTKRYTVPAVTATEVSAQPRASHIQDIKVFEQEFEEFNLNRFAIALNKTPRGRRAKTTPTQS